MFSRKQPYKDTKIRHEVHGFILSVVAATGIYPTVLDATFTPVSYEWFNQSKTQDALRKHFWALPRYRSQAWDCENFAVELNQWLCKEAALAGVEAAPESLAICVDNVKPWAGVNDGCHALNLVFFDTGPHVIEPQSIANRLIMCPVAAYPNKAFQAYQ